MAAASFAVGTKECSRRGSNQRIDANSNRSFWGNIRLLLTMDARSRAARLGDDAEQPRDRAGDARRARERDGAAGAGGGGLSRGAGGKDARARAARLGEDADEPRERAGGARRARKRDGAAGAGGGRLQRSTGSFRRGQSRSLRKHLPRKPRPGAGNSGPAKELVSVICKYQEFRVLRNL